MSSNFPSRWISYFNFYLYVVHRNFYSMHYFIQVSLMLLVITVNATRETKTTSISSHTFQDFKKSSNCNRISTLSLTLFPVPVNSSSSKRHNELGNSGYVFRRHVGRHYKLNTELFFCIINSA